MSVFASLLRTAYRVSGAKKAFALPEDKIVPVIEKQNRHRGVFVPTDRKAYYETIDVSGFPCLIVREKPQPAKRAILYFFGGGMVIGPTCLSYASWAGIPVATCGSRSILSVRSTASPRATPWFSNATGE